MTPIKTTPKDFFLHLASTILLYISAIALTNLVLSVINYGVRDALAPYFSTSSIAFPISTLIIIIPLLYILEWMIKKDIAKVPEKDSLWIRKWRTYLTLFLAGATIAGDLITLINTYINGEVSERFIFKFLAVLIIFGVIFTYYLLERTLKSDKIKLTQKILAWVGILIVVASIIGGFIIVGSPAKQRSLRFDQARVENLSNLQWQIVSYWQKKGKLPGALADLNDTISSAFIPVDPENKTAYDYTVKGDKNFQLCATFDLNSTEAPGAPFPVSSPMEINQNWTHGAGHVCFDRTIDQQIYPVDKPGITR